MPLDVSTLRDSGRRNAFVDACVQGQAGTTGTAPPYLDFRNIRDEKFGLTMLMLRRVVETIGPDRAVAFLQVTLTRLMTGELTAALPQVAATGVRMAFIRIRGLAAERATISEVNAYADVVEELEARGVSPVPDCVGRLGPPLMTQGATGFSGGTHNFRRVAQALLSTGGGGGGEPLSLELPTGGEVPRNQGGGSPALVTASARNNSPTLDDLREQRLRVWQLQARQAARDPEGFLHWLAHSGDQIPSAWAGSLLTRRRKIA